MYFYLSLFTPVSLIVASILVTMQSEPPGTPLDYILGSTGALALSWIVLRLVYKLWQKRDTQYQKAQEERIKELQTRLSQKQEEIKYWRELALKRNDDPK